MSRTVQTPNPEVFSACSPCPNPRSPDWSPQPSTKPLPPELCANGRYSVGPLTQIASPHTLGEPESWTLLVRLDVRWMLHHLLPLTMQGTAVTPLDPDPVDDPHTPATPPPHT